jgi:hypothetical protein
MKPLQLAPGLEALLLVLVTVTASFGIFEIVRRSTLLRPLFGLAARSKQPAVAPLLVPELA